MAESTGMIDPFEPGQVREVDGRQDRVLRHVELRLRHPLLARIQDLHQHQLDDRRPEGVRRGVVRRLPGRRVHHPAQLVRAGAHGGVLPHSAQCAGRCLGKSTYARCFSGDTRVALVDGTSPTLEEMARRAETGELFWGYSIGEDGRVVVDVARRAALHRTRHAASRSSLDNGEIVRATPDHEFMLRDGRRWTPRCASPGPVADAAVPRALPRLRDRCISPSTGI